MARDVYPEEHDDGYWCPHCGKAIYVDSEIPDEQNMGHCPHCKAIVIDLTTGDYAPLPENKQEHHA